MSASSVAILIDSCLDIPKEYIQKHNMYVVPVRILYKDGEFRDRVDITPQEVYRRMSAEVPKTSLPDYRDVKAVLDQIVADGYDTVLAITMSSGLSGTCNSLRLMAQEEQRVKMYVVDTLNIGIGAGIQAIFAGEMLSEGKPLSELIAALENSIKRTHIYFSVATLEYLRRGGRIGKVAAAIGTLLNIKPIITCNEEGVYVTCAKTRGHAQSIAEIIKLATKDAGQYVKYRIMVAHGDALQEAQQVLETLKQRLPACQEFILSELSPALGVHTGPGLVGVGVHPF